MVWQYETFLPDGKVGRRGGSAAFDNRAGLRTGHRASAYFCYLWPFVATGEER